MINMNWLIRHKRILLHFNMAFLGGLTGAYAILVRGGNFGAAQTMNLIEMVLDFADLKFYDALIRVGIFIGYGIAIVAAFLIPLYLPKYKYYIALIFEALCIAISGLIPLSANPLLALFPVFILNAYQWQTFTDPDCYNSSTIFSTNNYKQTLLSWTKYIKEKDLAQKRRAWIFTDTLIFFHIGVLFGYYAVKFLSEKGIWLTFLPIMTALILVSPVFEYHTITVESKSSTLPSRNTVK